MDGRAASLLLLALTVNCAAAPQEEPTAQDPWLQILNGGPGGEESQELVAEPDYQLQGRQEQEYQLQGRQEQEYQLQGRQEQEYQLQGRQEQEYQLQGRQEQEYQLQGRQEQEYQLQGRQEQEYQLQGRQEQEPVQDIQQVQPRRPQPAQQFEQRPHHPQRFANREQHPPRRNIRPRPGAHNRKPPGEKGIIGKITGTINKGLDGIKCSGSNFITETKLRDESFIRFQLDCARDLGPCDEIGEKIKILAPEVLAGRCPRPCNECTKNQIKRVMAQLSQRYPVEFREMLNIRRGPQRGR